MLNRMLTIFFWPFFMISGFVTQIFLLVRLITVRDSTRRQQLAQKYRLIWSALNLRLFFGTGSMRQLKMDAASLPEQFILVCNHRSNLDPLLVFVIGRPLVFLSKKSVLKTPVIGWWMRLCGDVPVDRGEKTSRGESLNAMRDRLQRGDNLLIFPEGTRQTDNEVPLGPFKDGAFNLAAQSGLPIVALVLDQTQSIWGKGSLWLNFRKLRYAISQPILTQQRQAPELKEQTIQSMTVLLNCLKTT